jgi:hypothetical protein
LVGVPKRAADRVRGRAQRGGLHSRRATQDGAGRTALPNGALKARHQTTTVRPAVSGSRGDVALLIAPAAFEAAEVDGPVDSAVDGVAGHEANAEGRSAMARTRSMAA